MATAPINVIDEDEVVVELPPITIAEILQGDNLVDLIPENEVNKLGSDVIRDMEIDDKSREEWLERYEQSLEIAMQVRRAKTFPWPGASNIKYPLLTVAAIQFQARAYPAIVDGSNLVKGRVLGPDPQGMKRQRADRIGQHMTWQLLYRMKDWEECTDKLLLMLPIVGCTFRKTYYDPIAQSNCSDMVPANDFIVNYWAKSLDTAPRYTQRLRLYPYEVNERVAAGLWRAVHFDTDGQDEDEQVEFYEQHRMADLDRDGVPEHYVITTTCDGAVARIVPCFDESGVYVRVGKVVKKLTSLTEEELALPDHPIVRVERHQYFTKYGFIPAPDGSFYDIGFGTLLYDLTAAIDATINQMIDAGTLQNAGGGFLGPGINLKGGSLKFAIGEWKRVDAGTGPLKDNILPMMANGPSPVLFQLLGMLIDAAKQITSVQDILTGGAQGPNTPATTTLAQIEQGMKVMTGIFKRIHRAFGQELRILFRLNRDFLDDEEYFQLNDEDDPEPSGPEQPGGPVEPVKIGRADYQDQDLDVIPVSDPTVVTDMQRMAKAQGLMPFMGNPLVNQKELLQRVFQGMGEDDIKKLLTVPDAPNPQLVIEGAKQALEKRKVDNATITARSNAAKALSEAAEKLLSLGLTADAAAIAGMATELGAEDDDAAAGPGGVPSMEGQPPDQGIPGVPEQPPVEPDGGMGLGTGADPGASSIGGPAEPVSGPVA